MNILFGLNHISGVMVSMLTQSVVDREFDPRSCQTKTMKIKIVFGASPLSTRHELVRAKTGWLGILERHVYLQNDVFQ